jgi:hypothetical protein
MYGIRTRNPNFEHLSGKSKPKLAVGKLRPFGTFSRASFNRGAPELCQFFNRLADRLAIPAKPRARVHFSFGATRLSTIQAIA